MNVVIVESPAKAKTVNKYLGPGYTVLATYGHVRDLPAKDGSVRPEDGFAMSWAVDSKAEKRIADIARALRGAENLYLATDPDREGEAISWHVLELLDQRGALSGVKVKRVAFNEVTRNAVLEAMGRPRDLDMPLIEAYLARRALDYLVGFTLSPVLWRKLPGSRSAGRVQSVALRLICEREAKIEAFRPREYWTVEADFRTQSGAPFTTQLTHLDGTKLDELALPDEAAARAAVAAIESRAFAVKGVERKTTRRHPAAPFTTSTLQQEAARKLHFGAKRTMQVAQKLYEGVTIGGETVGLITYMRTDGVQMAAGAVAACRRLIGAEYGEAYLPETPKVHKTKAKNAQEAHEAIRPTDIGHRPDDIAPHLDNDQRRLYALVWKRTVASQMASAVLDQMAVDVGSDDGAVSLRATSSVVAFDGFFRLYREGRDDAEDEDTEHSLPDLRKGEAVVRTHIRPEQHFTQPAPRFTEASLVKRLEELGIGRPSTYATILSVLQDRDYVRLEKKRFLPEDRGRLVTAFLVSFFEHYVEYDFTAQMEDQLDDISGGRVERKKVLRDFWTAFAAAVEETRGLTFKEVLEALDEELGPHFFPDDDSGRDPRACPNCAGGRLGLRLGKFGAFIGCSNYPECKYTRKLAVAGDTHKDAPAVADGPLNLGADPASGEAVTLRKGPYGFYVQLGEAKAKQKPRRVSLPKEMDPAAVTLETALGLLSLPREVGPHPATSKMITAGIGRFGAYLEHDGAYASLGGSEDVLTIGLNRAVDLLQNARPRQSSGPLRVLGAHPEDGKPVTLHKGRYGPYVKHGRINASLPKNKALEALSFEDALALIAARAAKGARTRKKTGKKRAGTGARPSAG